MNLPPPSALRDDEGVGFWVGQASSPTSKAGSHDLDLPLDLRATAFQVKVWQRAASDPVGETRNYSEIAAAIGQPTATRAVANACAKQSGRAGHSLPPHHPQADKSLGGYRWGIERKARAAGKREKLCGIPYRDQACASENPR